MCPAAAIVTHKRGGMSALGATTSYHKNDRKKVSAVEDHSNKVEVNKGEEVDDHSNIDDDEDKDNNDADVEDTAEVVNKVEYVNNTLKECNDGTPAPNTSTKLLILHGKLLLTLIFNNHQKCRENIDLNKNHFLQFQLPLLHHIRRAI
eukprot:gene12716-26787_t